MYMTTAKRRLVATVTAATLILSACGGDGGSGSGTVTVPGTSSGGTTGGTTGTSGCSLLSRQNWINEQVREWYLFPDTLPATLNAANYSSVDAYLDALTATARSQGKDRYFSYVTSIAEENAYYQSGQTAGFGMRLALDEYNRLVITESFEGTPALSAGIDRGAEITHIGTSASNLRAVSDILNSEGGQGLYNALGPDTVGTTRVFRVIANGITSDRSLTKADFEIAPVSSRYGSRIIQDGNEKIGYINLRTFIDPASAPLTSAFADMRSQGVTKFVVDFRYNGGGLISVAEHMGNLLGGNRSTSDIFDRVVFRAEKSSENTTAYFAPQSASVSPIKIAFIGTEDTASASEMVMNAMVPFLGQNAALIGSNTYGKPVGQIALDRAECDDRLRLISFAVQNQAGTGDYYNGLAGRMGATCYANDDLNYPLGDANEASVKAALDYLAGRQCSSVATAQKTAATKDGQVPVTSRQLLVDPETATTAQRETPGLF